MSFLQVLAINVIMIVMNNRQFNRSIDTLITLIDMDLLNKKVFISVIRQKMMAIALIIANWVHLIGIR